MTVDGFDASTDANEPDPAPPEFEQPAIAKDTRAKATALFLISILQI
jgi:hypothetical protein